MSSNYDPNQGQYAPYVPNDPYQQGYAAPDEPQRRKRGPMLFIVGILLVALIAVGGFFLFQTVLQPTAAGAERDKLLPSSTILYLSYNAAPSSDQQANWNKIRDAFLSQPQVKQMLDQYGPQAQYALGLAGNFSSQCSNTSVNGSILANLNEWVNGNVTIAWTQPSDSEIRSMVREVAQSFGFGSGYGSSSSQVSCDLLSLFESHAVALVSLDATPLNANGLIASLQNKSKDENKGNLSKAETYSGSDIYKFDLSGNIFYGAIIGQQVALSSGKDAVEAVVDANKESSKSLSSDSVYNAALGKFPSDRTATFYLDTAKLAAMSRTVLSELNGEGMNLNGAGINMVLNQLADNPNGILLGVTARANGVQIDASAIGVPALLTQMSNRDMVKLIPADAWAVFASSDLSGLVNQLAAINDSNQSFIRTLTYGNSTNSAQLKQLLKQSTTLDLDNDILSWMSGQWVDYIAPFPNVTDYSTVAYDTFVLNVHDSKDKAQAGIQKINQVLKDKGVVNGGQYSAKLSEVQVAGSTIYKVDTGDVSLYYGVVGDYFYMTNDTKAIETFNSGQGGLADSANYKGAMQNAISNNGMVLYANLQAMFNELEGYFRYEAQKYGDNYLVQNYEQNFKPFLIPFHSASLTSEGDKNTLQLELFVDIEK